MRILTDIPTRFPADYSHIRCLLCGFLAPLQQPKVLGPADLLPLEEHGANNHARLSRGGLLRLRYGQEWDFTG